MKYRCAPCTKQFANWRTFKRHMVDLHAVSERNLARRAAQLEGDEDVWAIRSDNGRWFLMGQPALL